MIKIRLEKWEKAVVMQVLEQDIEAGGGTIFSNNCMHLKSVGIPDIGDEYIYIRGKVKERDYRVVSQYFDNNELRDEYYDNVVKLFNDYNNRNKQPKEESNIFILE